ncbi:MAG TPA: thiamine diphosphokinase [Bacillales bacterium]|nr:thiamine diphosphokinase [Bacillales bacterium]
MNIHILAGGPVSLVPDFNEKKGLWVGVDRGVYELMQYGIQPDYAFGDFDSFPENEKSALENQSEVFVYPPEKDQTDLELAVDWALQQQPETLDIYGATGGRLDHEWANIQLLKKGLGTKTEMAIVDVQNRMILRSPGHYEIRKAQEYPYVSFLPLAESIKGLTLEGFKYPLDHMDIQADSTLTVSNELIAESGTYSFDSGIVLVIRSCDL